MLVAALRKRNNVYRSVSRLFGGVVALVVVALHVTCPCVAAEDTLGAALRGEVVRSVGMAVGVEVRDLDLQRVVFEHQSGELFKPASVQKLVLTAAALEELGPGYRFETEVRGADRRGSSVKTLTLTAGADPTLTIEALWLLARAVRARGIERVGEIQLDDGRFTPAPPRRGQRAYEAAASGLAFNFNSVTVQICPTEVGQDATVLVDPWELGAVIRGRVRTVASGATALKVEDVGPFVYEVGGRIRVGAPCSTVFRSVSDPREYLARVCPKVFAAAGVLVEGAVRWLEADLRGALLYTHRSKAMSEILVDLNHYSNNFTAQQIALVLDPTTGVGGGKLSLERGLGRLGGYVGTFGAATDGVTFADASGLDSRNRLTPALLGAVLQRMWDSPRIRTEFLASLSVAGRSGTLKKRPILKAGRAVIRAKTGTIAGVSSLAGVVTTAGGKNLGFVIIVNNAGDKEKAVAFEDRFVRILANSDKSE